MEKNKKEKSEICLDSATLIRQTTYTFCTGVHGICNTGKCIIIILHLGILLEQAKFYDSVRIQPTANDCTILKDCKVLLIGSIEEPFALISHRIVC